MSSVEPAKRMLSAVPPTDDDVAVPIDGRHFSYQETAEPSLNEVEAIWELATPTWNIAYGALRFDLHPLLGELVHHEVGFVVISAVEL